VDVPIPGGSILTSLGTSEDVPEAVVAAAKRAAEHHAPCVLNGPVEWVRTRDWVVQAMINPSGHHNSDEQEIYLIRLAGQLTVRAHSPLDRGPGRSGIASAIYVRWMSAERSPAGSQAVVRAGTSTWPGSVPSTALISMRTFDAAPMCRSVHLAQGQED
jgi:hypothetical protein